MLGHVEAISGLIRRMAGELGGDPPAVVLTGRDAAAPWSRQIEGVSVIDPELVPSRAGRLLARRAGLRT